MCAPGVYNEEDCNENYSICDPEDKNCIYTEVGYHGITIFGYGHDERSGKDYWLAKNRYVV